MILVTWAEIRNSSLGFLFCSFLFQTELIILERDCLGVIDNCFFSDFFHISNSPLVVRSFFWFHGKRDFSLYKCGKIKGTFLSSLESFSPSYFSFCIFFHFVSHSLGRSAMI